MKKKGFTLVEMLVVIAIIGVLAAIILPAVNKAREQAKNTTCRNNLRQFFVAVSIHADNNPSTAFSSGPFDPKRNGSIDVYGWVADMVNSGLGQPNKMLCPSSTTTMNEKINEYFGTITHDPNESHPDTTRINAGASPLVAAAATPTDKATAIVEHFLKKGYNTNYATTWFFGQTAPGFTATDTGSDITIAYGPSKYVKGFRDTVGPLTRKYVDDSYHSSSVIPIFADSNVGDQKEAFLVADLPGFAKAGERMCETQTDGPAFLESGTIWRSWGKATAVTIHDSAAGISIFGREQPKVGATPVAYPWTDLQDYRDIGPVHAGSANILFADGSIKSFKDVNKDGFLNPGFVPSSGADLDKIGYIDGVVELDPQFIFNGTLLPKFANKKNLD